MDVRDLIVPVSIIILTVMGILAGYHKGLEAGQDVVVETSIDFRVKSQENTIKLSQHQVESVFYSLQKLGWYLKMDYHCAGGPVKKGQWFLGCTQGPDDQKVKTLKCSIQE
jgi:hypothetical protein